jgi:hypothetical protein
MDFCTCQYCGKPGELVTGREVYPHRADLAAKPFWACLPCGAWVGCHPGTTKRLGRLANAELRRLRSQAHAAFDPLWKNGGRRRDEYRWLAEQMGIAAKDCHMGWFDERQCEQVVAIVAARQAT